MSKEARNKTDQIIGIVKVLTIFNKAKECKNPTTKLSFEVDVSTGKTTVELEGYAGMMLYGIGKMIVEVAGRCDAPLDKALEEVEEFSRIIAEVEQDEATKNNLTIKFNEE